MFLVLNIVNIFEYCEYWDLYQITFSQRTEAEARCTVLLHYCKHSPDFLLVNQQNTYLPSLWKLQFNGDVCLDHQM